MDKNWTRNPSLQNIDPAKIEMLLKLTEQGKGKSQKDLLPFLMAIAGQSKKNGMSFSSPGDGCHHRSPENRKVPCRSSENRTTQGTYDYVSFSKALTADFYPDTDRLGHFLKHLHMLVGGRHQMSQCILSADTCIFVLTQTVVGKKIHLLHTL